MGIAAKLLSSPVQVVLFLSVHDAYWQCVAYRSKFSTSASDAESVAMEQDRGAVLGTQWPDNPVLTILGVTANVESSLGYEQRVWNILGKGSVLDKSEASVALICLQEAPGWTSNISIFLERVTQGSQWEVLGQYENSYGLAGYTMNHQSLSVLVRPPVNSDYIWSKDKISDDNGRHCLSFEHPEIKGSNANFCTMLSNQKTSNTGKGAALALIDFENGLEDEDGRRTLAFRLAAACAHLDANTDKARDLHTDSIITGLQDLNSQFPQSVVENEAPGVDGMVFMGDLNYRLRRSVLGNPNRGELVNMILQHMRGGGALMKADPMGKYAFPTNTGRKKDATRAAAVKRYGFTCNTPEFQPPTYKIVDRHACHNFMDCVEELQASPEAEELHESPEVEEKNSSVEAKTKRGKCQTDDIGAAMFDFASSCYSGESLDQMVAKESFKDVWLKMKGRGGDKLQLGWLDRICWKTTDRRLYLTFDVEEDKMFAQDTWHDAAVGMSDHLPTLSKISFTWQY